MNNKTFYRLFKGTTLIGLMFQLSQASEPQTVNFVLTNTFGYITARASDQTYTRGELDDVIVTLDSNNYNDIELLHMERNSFNSFPSKLCSYFPKVQTLYMNTNQFTEFTKDAFE